MGVFEHALYERAQAHAVELAVQATRSAGRCTLLVRSFDETVAVKHLLASRGFSLGVQVVTLKDWLTDCWELFGNGRSQFDAAQRALMVRAALLAAHDRANAGQCQAAGAREGMQAAAGPGAAAVSAADLAPLSPTRGIVELVATVAKEALPAALAADRAQFHGVALQVLDVLLDYAQQLEQRGLVEESQVVDYLHATGALAGTPVVALDVRTTAAQDALLESLGANVVAVTMGQQAWEADQRAGKDAAVCAAAGGRVRCAELEQLLAALYRPDFSNPVQAQGAVRFAFAAGPYAHDQLTVDQLLAAVDAVPPRACDQAGEGAAVPAGAAADAGAAPGKPVAVSVLYAAKKPYQRFLDLAYRLADLGISSSVRAYVPMGNIDFGRAWINLVDFVATSGQPGEFDPVNISDFALSSFSFMNLGAAQSLDQRVRGWRGQTVDEALTDLSSFAREDRRDFIAAVAEGDLLGAVNLQIAALVTRTGWPEAYCRLQLAAATIVREVLERSAALSLPFDQIREELLAAGVPYSAVVAAQVEEPRAHVSFATLNRSAQEPPASVDVLVVDDLTAQDYPLKDDRTATDELMDQLGSYKPRQRVDQLRISFQHALRTPAHALLLMRCLNDSEAKEQRPAALLEELVDCYRCDPQNPAEVDKIMGLPSDLRPFGATLGEDQLSQALDPLQGAAQAQGVVVERVQGVNLSDQQRAQVLLPGRTPEQLLDYPVLSPSRIEAYLQCPHKWFVEARLGAGSSLGAGFGPLERGSFAHKVLDMTHAALRASGQPRVDLTNVVQAKELLGKLFQHQLEREKDLFPGGAESPYVPLTEAERLQASALMRQLQDYLEWEAGLLPNFQPTYSELEVGQDQPVEYAGLHVRGRVDRLDVDSYGRAVVVDYKGSARREYALDQKVAEGAVAPLHVQTLIYAQLVRRQLGLTPVGAVYVSYGKKQGISGAYDSQVLHPDRDLCGIKAESCASPSFLELLDRVEDELSVVLGRMAAGDVDPAPRSADVCTYCPALTCPKRGMA